MKKIVEKISQILNRNETLVMATVIKKIGPGPIRPGKKILINENLSLEGSFGSVLVNVQVKQIASSVFKTRLDTIETISFSENCVNGTGEICGGKIDVFFEYCDIIDQDTGLYYQKIDQLLNKKQDFVMISEISGDNPVHQRKWICTQTGFYGLENDEFHEKFAPIKRNFSEMKFKGAFFHEDQYFVEPYFLNEKVIIFGAGYIGQILTDLCKMLDFYVIVADDQAEFANYKRFPKADEVLYLPQYQSLCDYLTIDDQSFVLIMTRGNQFDQEVLAQVLLSSAKYIGMMGSKVKRNTVFQNMIERGFEYEDLQRIHCPVGLPIEGESPEEIAVSISAELIGLRRKKIL
ncbi:XdhC/CoxI family protein [Eubacteriaceae bacterium ES2]|nr:XdhC/CoxI family protein [Eubacteriaceae bacterium ES2]